MYNDHASVASLRQVDGMAGTRGRFHRNTQWEGSDKMWLAVALVGAELDSQSAVAQVLAGLALAGLA